VGQTPQVPKQQVGEKRIKNRINFG
jgi:hypothetical protein